MKNFLWRVVKCLSYRENAQCLKVNPVYSHPSCCFMISFYIVVPSVYLDLLRCHFPSSFHAKFCVHSFFSHTCLVFCLSHYPSYDHPNNIWRGVQITALLMHFSAVFSYFAHLISFHLPQHIVLKEPSACVLSLVKYEGPSFTHTHTHTHTHTELCIF